MDNIVEFSHVTKRFGKLTVMYLIAAVPFFSCPAAAVPR